MDQEQRPNNEEGIGEEPAQPASALFEQRLYQEPPPLDPQTLRTSRSAAWAEMAAKLHHEFAQPIPDEPSLAMGSPPKRMARRSLFKVFRPVARRYDRITAELADMGADLARRVEQTELELRGTRETAAAARGEMAKLSREVAATSEAIDQRLAAVSREVEALREEMGDLSGSSRQLQDLLEDLGAISGELSALRRLALPEEAGTEERESLAALEGAAHPEPPVAEDIASAREATELDAAERDGYAERLPEYELVAEEMRSLGLRPGDYVLDLGTRTGDLDRHLRDRGWWGLYVPVGFTIDGTDVAKFAPPDGFHFIVLQRSLEDVDNWDEVLDRVEAVAGAVVVLSENGDAEEIPQGEALGPDIPRRVWLTPDDFARRGYRVSLHSLGGVKDDTLVASKTSNVRE